MNEGCQTTAEMEGANRWEGEQTMNPREDTQGPPDGYRGGEFRGRGVDNRWVLVTE